MARVTLVTGMAQMGKTTLCLKVAKGEAKRLLILDPVRSKPFTEVVSTQQSWMELATFLVGDAATRESWTTCLRSLDFEDYIRALAAARYYRHIHLLIDEGLMFAQDTRSLEPLVALARMNAHFGGGIGVPIYITAQRPQDLPPDVRSQVDRCYTFRQLEPRDLQYLGERFSPDFAEQAAGLPDHQWIVFPSTKTVTELDNGQHDQKHPLQRPARGGSAGSPAHVPEVRSDLPSSSPDEVGEEHVQDKH